MPSGPAPNTRRIALAGIALALLLAPGPLGAQSNNVRITQLSDVAFGTPANLGVDATAAQSICVFAHTVGSSYRVTAMGSAPGGAFALTSGGSLLDYEVQWSPAAGQTSGTQLSSNVTLGGLVSSATQQTCNNGPPNSASLILLLRSSALSSARAGAYAGTLTLLIGPE
jgi:hypothetical protein